MFFILDGIPIPPTMDFSQFTPRSVEVSDAVFRCMEKRSQIVSAIVSISKDERPPNFDPAKVSDLLPLSMEMVS